MSNPDEINATDAQAVARVAATLHLKEAILCSMEYNPWVMTYDIPRIDLDNDATNYIDNGLRSRLEFNGTRTIEEAQRMRIAALLGMNYTEARNFSIDELRDLHGQTEYGCEWERQLARERLGLVPANQDEPEITAEPEPVNSDAEAKLSQAREEYETAKRRSDDGFAWALPTVGLTFALIMANDVRDAEAKLVAAAREATAPAPSHDRRRKPDVTRRSRFSLRRDDAQRMPAPVRHPMRRRHADGGVQPAFYPDEE